MKHVVAKQKMAKGAVGGKGAPAQQDLNVDLDAIAAEMGM
jgi:hypothetical protein